MVCRHGRCGFATSPGIYSYGSARIVVEKGWLQAGRARIEVKFIGSVLALDNAATRELSGPLADARAFLLLRPYLPRAVRVDIDDPDDPTPYWLVNSRRSAALVAALDQTRRPVADGKTDAHSTYGEISPS